MIVLSTSQAIQTPMHSDASLIPFSHLHFFFFRVLLWTHLKGLGMRLLWCMVQYCGIQIKELNIHAYNYTLFNQVKHIPVHYLLCQWYQVIYTIFCKILNCIQSIKLMLTPTGIGFLLLIVSKSVHQTSNHSC